MRKLPRLVDTSEVDVAGIFPKTRSSVSPTRLSSSAESDPPPGGENSPYPFIPWFDSDDQVAIIKAVAVRLENQWVAGTVVLVERQPAGDKRSIQL